MILGVIYSVDNLNGLKVTIDGESAPSTKKYSYLASYVPTANDRVLIEEINGSYVILGKICTEVAQSGIVRQAATAAACTGNAATATTAASCTGNAATATTAASCSGNAATATTAAACSGNAATATVSNTTKGFDYSVNSHYGQLVTNVTREYDSTLGKYIVTDVQTGYAANFTYK